MNRTRQIRAGARMFFGVPANPMPKPLVDAISQVVRQVPGIVEAYLPQCYIEGDAEARQVLIIGVESESRIPVIVQDLGSRLEVAIPPQQFIDIIPFSIAEMCSAARVAECRIMGSAEPMKPKKPWWKVW